MPTKAAGTRRRLAPSQPRAERTRLRLLDAARRLFTVRGYNETSIEDLAAAVQMSKGAFYFHFATKEEILLAVMDRWAEDRLARLRSTIRGRDPRQAVGAVLRLLISPNAAGRRDGRLLFRLWAEADRSKEVRERLAKVDASWRKVLAEILTQDASDTGEDIRGSLLEVVLAMHDGLLLRNLLGLTRNGSWRMGADALLQLASVSSVADLRAGSPVPEFLRRNQDEPF